MAIDISDDQFKDNGYHRYDGGSCRLNHSDYLWQKRFRGPNGETRYFLNCWIYKPINDWSGGIMAEACMHQEEGESWYTFQMHRPTDIKIMEEFFSRAYKKLEMIPDPHNQ